MKAEKKTPLYEAHKKAGGKMVPFAGYMLPVQYETGVNREHMAVREGVGIFDVSHMGELALQGPDALANLNMLLTNDFTDMKVEQARYSPMCNEKGGVVDDLIVYKIWEEYYFIVVNAANKDKDFKWIQKHMTGDVTCKDISDQFAQIAVQGPKAMEVMRKISPEDSIPARYYHVKTSAQAAGVPCMVSTTGYTGEDGVELYLPAPKAVDVWDALLEVGADEGLIPCGLGARDTLRMEAGMPLYGHEMNDEISPLEAGLGFAVKMDKPDFIGKSAIEEKKASGLVRVGLDVTGRGIVREHQQVLDSNGNEIGTTTSGTKCPSQERPVAMAIVPKEYSDTGTELIVDVRGRMVECRVTELPFYKKA